MGPLRAPIHLFYSVFPMLYTIRGLDDKAIAVNIRVRVVSKEAPRKVKTKDNSEHVVVDTLVGDRTGTINLSVWDETADQVVEGDIIDITNGYVNRFKGRLKLNIGRYGSCEKVQEFGFPTAEDIIAGVKQRIR